MNILDENIPESQRLLLRSWRIRTQQIGHELGRRGMKDEKIITLLHQLRRPTFFTRDLDFYDPQLCHAGYCVVCLTVGQYETASFIRRFLKHPEFGTQSKRRGTVVRVSHTGMKVWRIRAEGEEEIEWRP
jgi:hypothetical protein